MTSQFFICTECVENRFYGSWLQAYERGWTYIKEDNKETTVCPNCMAKHITDDVTCHCTSCRTSVIVTDNQNCTHCGNRVEKIDID